MVYSIMAKVSQIFVSREMPIQFSLFFITIHAASGTLFILQYSWISHDLYSGC